MSTELSAYKAVNRTFIFSLSLALFGTSMLDVLSSLFLVDLATTFLGDSSRVSIAIVSQIVTISSIAAMTFGVLSGFLSVKVNHKTLLLFGALCIVIGTVGCLFAPNLLFLQIFYPFDGIGTIIVSAMCFTIIGETLPLEKRAKSIGVLTSMWVTSTAIGFALAGYFANVGGWRLYLNWYVLPVAIIAVFLAFFIIPKNLPNQTTLPRRSFRKSFKDVLLSKSATTCLIGNMFLTAGGTWSFFAATFWRQKYLLPVEVVALITVGVTMIYALGGFLGGQLIDKVGRKRFVVASWIIRGLLILSIVLMPTVWTALLMSIIATFVGGLATTGGHTLFLEQAPNSRGTMMSIAAVFASIGVSLGVALGGLALTNGFEMLGISLGILTVTSAIIMLLFSKDKCDANYTIQPQF
jgi:predicted MFS family arabinose efflux permease